MNIPLQISLQIVLGLNCNFACKHCLNSSRPNYNKFDLDEAEILFLSDLINQNENISSVAFNGGEPLLYLTQMLALKSKVRRPVHWTMTSNGSKIPESLEGLKELKLDAAVLSFDKYHQTFFDEQQFKNVVIQLKNIIPRIEVNFVYEELDDLQTFSETLNDAEVTVIPTRLIKSGRAKDLKEHNSKGAELVCPNVRPQNTKVTYFPKKGFTVCCGPLLFDHNLEDESFFTRNISDLFQTFEFRASKDNTAERELLKKLAADESGEICTRCTKATNVLFKESLSADTVVSLDRKFLLTKGYLSARTEKALSKNFHVKYFIRLEPGLANTAPCENRTASIKIERFQNLSELQINEFRDFTIDSFYDAYPSEYDKSDKVEFVNGMKVYFEGETETVFFRKGDSLAAVLTLYFYEKHPLTDSQAYHIGYWGYDRNLVTIEEARYIKKEWLNSLTEVALKNKIPVVGLIDYFNHGVRKMITRFGFELEAVRLDKRP